MILKKFLEKSYKLLSQTSSIIPINCRFLEILQNEEKATWKHVSTLSAILSEDNYVRDQL